MSLSRIRTILLGITSLCLAVAASTAGAAPIPRVQHEGSAVPHNSTFSFGSTVVGQDLVRTFTVINDGDQDLTVGPYSFAYSGAPLNSYSVENANVIAVPPGASGTFDLRFHADGEESTTWKIHLFVGGASRYEFWVSATVAPPLGPILRVQLGSNVITQNELVDFGSTGVGIPLTRTFTAFNDGDQPLTLAPIAIGSQVGDPASFDIGFNNAFDVPPGGSSTFRLDFDAGGLGSVTSEIDLWVHGLNRRQFFVKGTALEPAFEISLSPATRTVEAGRGVAYTVSTTPLYGFNGLIALTIADLPAVTTHSFTPVDVVAGATSRLWVQTLPETPPIVGTIFTVTGTNGSVTASATARIHVVEPGDFTLAVSPALRTLNPGDSTSYSVTVDPLDGFDQDVSLSHSGLPAGATASFNPQTLTPPGISTLTVNTAASTPLGDSTLTISGTGGGKTRTDTSTLRLIDTAAGEPSIDQVTPNRFLGGQVVSMAIDGQNFQGSSVTIATTPVDPGDPIPAVFPDVTLVSLNATGTHMVVELDATDSRVAGFYNMVVETAAGQAGAPFRVHTGGPEVDLWTPKEPARGETYNLSMLGVNLGGARISVTGGGGVDAFVVASSSNRLTGFLSIASDAALGSRNLVIVQGGRQTQIPITVIADTQGSSLQTLNLTEGAAQAAAKKGEKVPKILQQEFSLSDQLAWAGQNGQQVAGLCSVTLRWQIYNFFYSLAVPFDPGSGRILFDILRNMGLGVPVPVGVRILSAFGNLFLEVRFDCFPISHLQVCLLGHIGFEIPGLGGQIWSAGGCFAGGRFFPVRSTTGFVGNFTFRNDGQCTDVTQLSPPNIGEQQAVATMNSCCTEDLRIDTTGSSFPGTIYEFDFVANDHPVAPMSPVDAQCACPCEATLSPVDLKPGENKALEAKLRNISQDSCTYSWTMRKNAGNGATPSFTPSSGSVTLGPGQEQSLGVAINLPSTIQDGRSPTIELNGVGQGAGFVCAAQTDLCVIPLEESSRFLGWTDVSNDRAVFQGVLKPAIDWTDEMVTEGPPGSGTGTYDNCYFEGSTMSEYTDENSIDSDNSLTVIGDVYEPDVIGSSGQFDEYYRALNRTPCTLGTTQHVKRVCPDVSGTRRVEYTTNIFFWDVGETHLVICRDDACSTPH